MFTGYSNSVSKRGKVPKHVITAMKVLEAYLNTPEGWPEKKGRARCKECPKWEAAQCPICAHKQSYYNYYDKAIDECKKAAVKGCPCCGVARIVEKQSKVFLRNVLMEVIPQTYGEAIVLYPWLQCEPHEWDNRTTLENFRWFVDRLKEKQATPEEIIDRFEEASHSADNSTLTFKEKQAEPNEVSAEIPTVKEIVQTVCNNRDCFWYCGTKKDKDCVATAEAIHRLIKSKMGVCDEKM